MLIPKEIRKYGDTYKRTSGIHIYHTKNVGLVYAFAVMHPTSPIKFFTYSESDGVTNYFSIQAVKTYLGKCTYHRPATATEACTCISAMENAN